MASTTVLPGDIVEVRGDAKTRLGLGLLPSEDGIQVATFGVVKRGGLKGGSTSTSTSSSTLWVDSRTKRYYPQVDDMVVGTIVEKHAETYRVDIGLSQHAVLPALAFEGATKRNKPNLDVGSLIYCRVRVANKHMEVELTCQSPLFKKDWVTKDSMFGELSGGYVFNVSSQLARALLEDDSLVLNALGRHFPFEIAIGANGRVWINSGTPMHSVILSNVIIKSETLQGDALLKYIDTIASSVAAA